MEKGYEIACLKCSATRQVRIHQTPMGDRVDWQEDKYGTDQMIVSARKRLDDQWGFQCACGNNDLMTAQEAKTFTNPAVPTPQEISEIVSDLKPDKPMFSLKES